MKMKTLLVMAVIGISGLSLSSCVSESGPYDYNTYGAYPSSGYYGGQTLVIGGGDPYRSRYRHDRYDRSRYHGNRDRYERRGRPEHHNHRPENRPNGSRGWRHHRRIPEQ
jgi:hypothetical protein